MLREKELILLENLKKENARKTEEIQQLRNNQLIGQASGEEIVTITDGALAFANILEETEIEVEGVKKKAYLVGLPQGISRQEQREGYNLFDAINSYPETHTKTGITFTKNSDGTFNAHGTATSDTSIGLAIGIMGYLVAGEEYSLYSNIPYNNNTFNLSLTYGGEGMTNKYILANSSKILDDITQWASLNLYIPNGQTINVDNVKVMICKGAYDSSKPFEQYGETPSIEIPSEIENVKVWNLFDVSNVAETTTMYGVTVTRKNDEFTIEGTCNSPSGHDIILTFELPLNIGKYKFKIFPEFNNAYFSFRQNKNTWIQDLYSTNSSNRIINITENSSYMIALHIISGRTYNTTFKMQIVEGIEDKPYAPYGAINIGLENSNINDEVYELGGFTNDTGENTNQSDRFRIKNYIDIEKFQSVIIKSNVQSFINAVGRYGLFDENKVQIENAQITSTNYTINTKNAKYLRFWFLNNTSENFDMNTAKIIVSSEATDYVEHQEQNYNLHLGDLELNGIGDTRDSLVIELKDENMSCKKIKKLYLKKRFEKYIFNGTEIINFGITREKFTKMNISFLNSKTYRVQHNYESSVGLLLSNYFKVLTNADAQWLNDSVEDITLNASGNITFSVSNDFAKTAEEFKAKLLEFYNNSRPLEIIYRLNKPELIDITDNIELVKDVEYLINNFKTFKEVTHIEIDNGYIDLEYIKFTELALKNIQQQIDNISALMLEGGTNNA